MTNSLAPPDNRVRHERRGAAALTCVSLTISQFCKVYGVGRSYTYILIHEGVLEVRKAGTRTLIAADSANRWWASLSRGTAKVG